MLTSVKIKIKQSSFSPCFLAFFPLFNQVLIPQTQAHEAGCDEACPVVMDAIMPPSKVEALVRSHPRPNRTSLTETASTGGFDAGVSIFEASFSKGSSDQSPISTGDRQRKGGRAKNR